MPALTEHLSSASKTTIIIIGTVVVLLLGTVDYITGYEISFALFYLIPVMLTSWYAGKIPGALMSIVCAFVWQQSNFLAGECHTVLSVYFWNTGMRFGFFMLFTQLIIKLKDSLEVERILSHTDFLTGALNSRAFFEVIKRETLRSHRYNVPFTLAYIDLDNFKSVNDTFGYETGDILLKTVAESMRKGLRTTDVVSRLGGDEFAIMMPQTDNIAVRQMMPKLRKSLLDRMVAMQWPVTFSIGVKTFINPPENENEIIKEVDTLMYNVKLSGKNRIEFDASG